MMPGKDFMSLMEAERKLARGQTLSDEEQRVVGLYGITKPKQCGYKGCRNNLGPRVDGEHHKLGGVEVCEECYFDAFGQLEMFPIGFGIRRTRGCGLLD